MAHVHCVTDVLVCLYNSSSWGDCFGLITIRALWLNSGVGLFRHFSSTSSLQDLVRDQLTDVETKTLRLQSENELVKGRLQRQEAEASFCLSTRISATVGSLLVQHSICPHSLPTVHHSPFLARLTGYGVLTHLAWLGEGGEDRSGGSAETAVRSEDPQPRGTRKVARKGWRVKRVQRGHY